MLETIIVIIVVLVVGGITIWRIETMGAELTRLQAEVAEMSDAVDAGVALIEGLAGQIRDNASDPAALTALADSLDASARKLAAAVATNTAGGDDVTDDEDLEPIPEPEPAPDAGEEEPPVT